LEPHHQFFFFQGSFLIISEYSSYSVCTTMAECYIFVAHMGLLSGGGIGDFISASGNAVPDVVQEGGWVGPSRILFEVSSLQARSVAQKCP
jgi:hypothetical protein